jgi:hypothetical protein
MSENQLSNLCDRVITDSKSRKSQDFLALHVKSLVLIFGGFGKTWDAALKNALIVLKACSKVDRLALPGYGFRSGDSEIGSATQTFREFVAGSNLSPRQLFIGGALFPRDQQHFSCSIFQNVTHLELPCPCLWDRWDWNGLRYLTNLTHLSTFVYRGSVGLDWVSKTVAMSPRHLRVFIFWVGPLNSPPSDEMELIRDGGVDPRVVLGSIGDSHSGVPVHPYTVFLCYEDFTCRKYSSQNDRWDFWTFAEGIVDERLQRNLQVRCLATLYSCCVLNPDYAKAAST